MKPPDPAIPRAPRNRAALEAALATARATVATLEAALAADEPEADELLDLPALHARFGIGRAALLGAVERRELEASRGPRGRILVRRSAVETWLASRPVTVKRPLVRASVTSIAEWERAQERELERRAGGKR